MFVLNEISAQWDDSHQNNTGSFISTGGGICTGLMLISGFSGLGIGVLASGTGVRGFKPSRSRRIFRAKESSARLLSEGK